MKTRSIFFLMLTIANLCLEQKTNAGTRSILETNINVIYQFTYFMSLNVQPILEVLSDIKRSYKTQFYTHDQNYSKLNRHFLNYVTLVIGLFNYFVTTGVISMTSLPQDIVTSIENIFTATQYIALLNPVLYNTIYVFITSQLSGPIQTATLTQKLVYITLVLNFIEFYVYESII